MENFTTQSSLQKKVETEKNERTAENKKDLELLNNAIDYLTSTKEEEKEALYLKIKDSLLISKIRGIKKEVSDPEDLCREILTSYLEEKNINVVIPDKKDVSHYTNKRKILFENDHVEIAISSGEEYIKNNVYLKELLEIIETVAKDFITPALDPFKADIALGENFLSMRMDPGKHKEFIGMLLPSNKGAVLVHKHTPSQYEKTNPNNTFRQKYISKITKGTVDEKNSQVTSLIIRTDLKLFEELFRLCQSVKNLDLISSKDLVFTVNMFNEGATNMESFLGSCDSCDKLKSQHEFDNYVSHNKSINPKEKELLKKYFENNVEKKIAIKKGMELLRRAKDLNFEIISDLIDLEKEVRSALSFDYERPTKGHLLLRMYQAVAKKIIEMENLVAYSSVFTGSIIRKLHAKEITEKLEDNMEPIISLARMGFGTSAVLRDENGEIDMGELARKRLPKKVAYAYDRFSEIIDDRGQKLESWEDIISLQEAVRFLHELVVKTSSLYITSIYYDSDDKFIRTKNKSTEEWSYTTRIADLSTNGLEKTEIGKTIMRTINRLGYYSKLNIFNPDESKKDRRPVMIFSDNLFELTLPTEKHYIELNAQSYENSENKEYTISWRYVESGYPGSAERQDLVAVILEKNRFRITRNGYHLNGQFNTEKKEEWKENLKMIINLVATLKDLDLGRIREDTADWFEKGVIELFGSFRQIEQWLSLGTGFADDDSKKEIEIIMRLGSVSEKELLAKMLADNMTSFKKDLAPYLEKLDSNQLDDFISCLFELEQKVKKEKNKKLADRLRRIQENVLKLMDEVEKK